MPPAPRPGIGPARSELEALYRRYNACCKAHDFDRLGEFVMPDVEVNGEIQGLDSYVAGLRAVVTAFPDYRWDIRHLFVDDPWVFVGERIAEVWVAADNLAVLDQLR